MHYNKHSIIRTEGTQKANEHFLSSGIRNVSSNKQHLIVYVFYDSKIRHTAILR